MMANNRFAWAACTILMVPSCHSRQFTDIGSSPAVVTSQHSVATKLATPGVHKVAECNGAPDGVDGPVREHAFVTLVVSKSFHIESVTLTHMVQTRTDSGDYVTSLDQFQGVPASVQKDESGVVSLSFHLTTGTRTLNGKVSTLSTVAELVLDADDSGGSTKNVAYQYKGDNAMRLVRGCTFTDAELF